MVGWEGAGFGETSDMGLSSTTREGPSVVVVVVVVVVEQ